MRIKFHEIHHRELPQSAKDKEREFMEYNKSHPFKAIEVQHQRDDKCACSSELCRKKKLAVLSHEELELQECKNKQFKALPLPSYYHRSCGESKNKPEQTSVNRKRTLVKMIPKGRRPFKTNCEARRPSKTVKPQSPRRYEYFKNQLEECLRKRKEEVWATARVHITQDRSSDSYSSPCSSPGDSQEWDTVVEIASEAKKVSNNNTKNQKSKTGNRDSNNSGNKSSAGRDQSKSKIESNEINGKRGDGKQLKNQATAKKLETKLAANSSTGTRTLDLSSSLPWSLLFMVFTFRVLNTFLIQSYFDPDEFWQNLEPAYCEVFSPPSDTPCAGLTWEWRRRPQSMSGNFVEDSLLGPIRSYISILPTLALYKIAKTFGIDSHWLISRGPMVLNSLLVAAPVDIAVWYAAHWMTSKKSDFQKAHRQPAWCLFCSLFSWFNGYSLVRTYANSQETLLLILAVAIVSPELIGNVNMKWGTLRSCLAFLLGGLSVAIRFTALAAFVPMGILLGLRRPGYFKMLSYLFVPCALFGALGIGITVLVDRFFYGFWTLPVLGSFHFNVLLDKADIYGTHPSHWYFTAGLPAVAGTLLPFLFWDFVSLLKGRASYGQRNLWIIIVSYLAIMSTNAHKEFRFIHPVLPLICLLTGQHVQSLFLGRNKSRSRMLFFSFVFVAANLLPVLFLGLYHQSGVVQVNHYIVATALHHEQQHQQQKHFSVHYLTGECHSTPLHSHLHSLPSLSFETRSLDCSPECRAAINNSNTPYCETDQFVSDPVAFLGTTYFGWCGEDELDTCTSPSSSSSSSRNKRRSTPDFVVTYSQYAGLLQPTFEYLGLREVARFPHHVIGASLLIVCEPYYCRLGNQDDETARRLYRKFTLAGGLLEVTLDEVILFSKV